MSVCAASGTTRAAVKCESPRCIETRLSLAPCLYRNVYVLSQKSRCVYHVCILNFILNFIIILDFDLVEIFKVINDDCWNVSTICLMLEAVGGGE